MLDTSTADHTLTPDEARQLDRACDAFESDLQAGRRPSIEQFLAAAPAAVRNELLRELLELEVAYRKRAGESPTLGEYLKRFPEYLTATRLAETPLAEDPAGLIFPTTGPANATAPAAPLLPRRAGRSSPVTRSSRSWGAAGWGWCTRRNSSPPSDGWR